MNLAPGSLYFGIRLTGLLNVLIIKGDGIIVGLSGGPDSVFLTHILGGIRKEKRLALLAAHVNYSLRGQESDEDERFCRKLAADLDIPIDVKACDLSHLKKSPGNLQATARQERMIFFEQLLQKYKFDKIALGHTHNDNIETVLANIIRGCGLPGLSGIADRIGKVIRPLLHISKAEITDYLDQNQIAYRVDSSNLETNYMRNRIRNTLIPLLKTKFNPRIDKAITRLSRFGHEADAYFKSKAQSYIKAHVKSSLFGNAIIDLLSFNTLEPIVKRYVLKDLVEVLCERSRGLVANDLIESALETDMAPSGARIDLGGSLMLERDSQCLVIFRPPKRILHQDLNLPGKIALKEYNLVLNSKVEEKIPTHSEYKKDNWSVTLDMDKLESDFKVRQFENGDYFQPLGMKNAKKLSDFLTDRKIPRALRTEIPLLVCGKEIIWVIGEEISEKCRIDDTTRRVLKLWIENIVKNGE